MITDDIMEAIDLMISLTADPSHRTGMEKLQEMLGDFDEDRWMSADREQRRRFIVPYILNDYTVRVTETFALTLHVKAPSAAAALKLVADTEEQEGFKIDEFADAPRVELVHEGPPTVGSSPQMWITDLPPHKED